ncbi:MAG TPA: hypothetical protein VNV42_10085 [Solirubrobacteraceae bacterium]|nr:hypothetical protein [Solirubrobacteraceae bacterium]
MGGSSASGEPTGGYSVFSQCPTRAAGVDGCIYGQVEGGYMRLGNVTVAITKTLTLQGGLLEEQETFLKEFAPALNDESLTNVAQPGPDLGGHPLSITAELAAPASAIWLRMGPKWWSLTLPIKLRLENQFFAHECEIGSNTNPIQITLTTGVSAGLGGHAGKKTTMEQGGILVVNGMSMVTADFAVPKATGCGSTFLNEIVDAILDLPSENSAIVFNAKIEIANSELVQEAQR